MKPILCEWKRDYTNEDEPWKNGILIAYESGCVVVDTNNELHYLNIAHIRINYYLLLSSTK